MSSALCEELPGPEVDLGRVIEIKFIWSWIIQKGVPQISFVLSNVGPAPS